MLYTEKMFQREIDKRMYEEERDNHFRRRCDEIERHLIDIEKRLCALEAHKEES